MIFLNKKMEKLKENMKDYGKMNLVEEYLCIKCLKI